MPASKPPPQHPPAANLRDTWAALAEIYVEVKATDALLRQPITETLSKFLAAQYAIVINAAVRNAGDAHLDPRTLAAFACDVAALRKGDQNAEWLRLERRRLTLDYRRLRLATQDAHKRWMTKFETAMAAFENYVSSGPPDAKAAFAAFAQQVSGPCGNPTQAPPKPHNPTQSDPIRPLNPTAPSTSNPQPSTEPK
jgi:hypothetical protein